MPVFEGEIQIQIGRMRMEGIDDCSKANGKRQNLDTAKA
jgi:hypothetical protein